MIGGLERRWRTYFRLTDRKALFRSFKSELRLPPVYHQTAGCTEGLLTDWGPSSVRSNIRNCRGPKTMPNGCCVTGPSPAHQPWHPIRRPLASSPMLANAFATCRQRGHSPWDHLAMAIADRCGGRPESPRHNWGFERLPNGRPLGVEDTQLSGDAAFLNLLKAEPITWCIS